MKKLFMFLICCVMLFSVAGCKDEEGEDIPDNGSNLPSIPDGVKLPDVGDDDIAAKLSEFVQKYESSDNMYLDFYMSYANSVATGSARYEGKIYGDNANGGNYKDALGDMGLDIYEQTETDGNVTERHTALTVRLRGESCFVVTDGTLSGMYTDGYHGSVSPMDYMAGLADDRLNFSDGLGTIIGHMQTDKYTADVRADGEKLYAAICFTEEAFATEYRFYLDTAAGYKATDFGSGAPASFQTADILYYTADRSDFLSKFLGGEEIKLYPAGHGNIENLSGSTSVTVNYIYDGRNGNVNLNIGFYGGELYIPENSFEVLCNKLDSSNFALEKLTMFYFEIVIRYEGAGKTCESIIFIDY